MGNFVYKARPEEAWSKRSKQSGSQYEGFIIDAFKTFVPKKENWIRILPPTWDNPQHYGLDIWVHYGVGPNNASVLCTNRMLKEKCPLCEAEARAEAQGREDSRQFKPTRRVLVWLIDRNEEKNSPLLWAAPWTVDRDISKVSRDRQTGELYQIDHPEAGYDVTFDREGEGMNVKYVGVALARRPTPVAENYLKFITENPVPTSLNWRSYEEVQALFEGGAVIDPTAGNMSEQSAPSPGIPVNTPTQPVPTPIVTLDFCDKTFVFKGQKLGCSREAGHPGAPESCNFERELSGNGSGAKTPPPVVDSAVVPISQPATPPTSATSASSKAAAMRERFRTGQQNK